MPCGIQTTNAVVVSQIIEKNKVIFSIRVLAGSREQAKFIVDNWKQNEGKNDIVTKGHIYLDMARNSGLFIQEFAKNYDNIRKSKSL